MKSRFLALLALLATSISVEAQNFAPEDFIYPLKNVARLYSANFGELRPDHFHSGVDIKTDGKEGKEVVAVADGYISRIALSPYGYGLALYVTHYNGTTSVYGHLSRFREDVAKFVESERYRTKSHTANLFCNSKSFPVKQGELIAYSGNSGSSSGPHLHYEIRESATQGPINIFSESIISPKDDISPLIFAIHYVEIDSLQGVAHKAKRRSFDVAKSGDEYQIAGGGAISVGRKGYFVVEVSDRKCDVTNTFAIYSLSTKLDDEVIYKYSMDGFTFDRTRYCNSISYYPIKINSRNEVFRLAQTENGDGDHYSIIKDRGLVRTTAGENRSMQIDVVDDCGNSSTLKFNIRGKSDESCFKAESVDPSRVILAKRDYTYSQDGMTVLIPSNTLYESVVFEGGLTQRAKSEFEEREALSPIYTVLNKYTPLHSYMTISIAADIPMELCSKAGLICVGRSGAPSFIKGNYNMGSVSARSRNGGDYYVAVDTTAPELGVGINEGADESRSSYFTCKISDDLSGTASYSATLDGEWIALNLQSGRLRHNFREPADGTMHKLVITATDAVGNTATVERNFKR